VILFLACVVVVGLDRLLKRQWRKKARKNGTRTGLHQQTKELTPPLPREVVRLLKSTSLCHLSTQGVDGTPHLSLMRFTYLPAEEKIIISTRRSSQKFDFLEQNPLVALLVHDFPHMQDEGERGECGRTFSITLNGSASIETGDAEARYRALHLQENPEYEQFIVGPNIAIVSVTVTSARICNLQDKVKVWTLETAQEGL